MPTVIDSLILSLELDPANFTKGQKEAANAFLKTKNEAVSSGKTIEDASKKAADSISRIAKEALTLYAVFLGARGIKEFVADLTSADAALGRFSRNLGESPQTISAWGMAAERMGGSAEATAGSFERIGKSLYDLHRNGAMLPKEFSQLQALTGKNIDADHGVDKFLTDTATALKAMNAIDPSQAHFLAQGMGIDDGTANVMIKYGDAIGGYIDQLKRLSPSNDAIKAAQDLQEKWNTLQQTAVSLANTILSTLGPELATLLTQMTDWVDKNQDWIKSGIVDGVKQFADYLKDVDWNAVGQGLKDFGNGAHQVTEAIGGITSATELLIALWAGSKAIGMIASLRTIAGGSAAATIATAASEIKGGAAPAKPSTKVSGPGIGSLLFGALGAYNLVDNIPTDPDELKKFMAENGQRSQGWNKWLEDNVGSPRSWLGLDGRTEKNTSGSPDDRDANRTNLTPYGAPKTIAQQISEKAETTVDGRPVNKGNPLPVTVTDKPDEKVGFWSNVGSAVSNMFGIGTASASPGPSSGSNGPIAATGPSAGEKGWWTKDRQQHAYERLTKEAGLSDQGAKALISRWKNVEASGGPGEVNSIGATGIAQMLGPRKKRLQQMAGEKGVPVSDYDLQLSHAIEELNGSERKAAQRLRSAKTAEEGAIGASMYERAEGYNPLTGTDNFTGRTMGGMRGIDKYVGSVLSDQATAGRLNATNNNDNRSTSSSSHEMHVGAIHVNAPNAKDSDGIASKITDSLYRSSVAATANYGPR